MSRSTSFVLLAWLLLLAVSERLTSADSTQESTLSSECYGSPLIIAPSGSIISHAKFGKRFYPTNMFCKWSVQTFLSNRIVLQSVNMSLEYSKDCLFDYVEVFDGATTDAASSLGRFCGGSPFKVLASSTQITVVFRSDSTLNKSGFQLRYYSTNVSRDDENLLKQDKCTSWESTCTNKKVCIRKNWVCDGQVDCPDGSDEVNCPPTFQLVCNEFTKKCFDESLCVPKNFWCDGQPDCKDKSDETSCQQNNPLTVPANDRSMGQCSRQAFANRPDGGRIVGGVTAVKGSWPWIVSLRVYQQHVCGGTIVNENWIVTAAHCVYNYNDPSLWQVDAGAYIRNQPDEVTQSVQVAQILIHPQYDPQSSNHDLALMQLASPLTFNNYVQPVCFPRNANDQPREGDFCFVTGWGTTQNTGGEGYLKQALVPVVDHDSCNTMYGNRISDVMLCAGYQMGGVDACQGDSGGPLVCKLQGRPSFTLYGVTSWGDECAAPNKPGIYSNVAELMEWAQQYVQLKTA